MLKMAAFHSAHLAAFDRPLTHLLLLFRPWVPVLSGCPLDYGNGVGSNLELEIREFGHAPQPAFSTLLCPEELGRGTRRLIRLPQQRQQRIVEGHI
jgi:hypothetical protein